MMDLPFNDPVIAKIHEHGSLKVIEKTSNLFVDLVEDIVSQQLSGRVAETIFKRFCAIFPNSMPSPDLLDKCSIEELRAVGLSNAKANYVKNIAKYALENNLTVELFDKLSDEDIINELTKIKGVGVWTAQMVLIFSLNRPDVFPPNDLAIQQQMKKLYRLNHEGKELVKAIVSISEKWKPNRTIGTRLVWNSINIEKTQNIRF
ncbi:MAG: DNA-3-methyladenine glycosylase 2 family protein [Bacteroidetes bacterium HGW-Bacteroidetes-15]|nr:MAG: DNA-3-methyladenine glycosylase 2 family protein [Bacteroidetes bacterium HGW-Bacteroidetes-15]